VDLVEVAFCGRKRLSTVALAGVGKLTNECAWFAPLDKCHLLGGLAKVLVVTEPVVAGEVVDLLRGEILERV
jgi:hypothetical protein